MYNDQNDEDITELLCAWRAGNESALDVLHTEWRATLWLSRKVQIHPVGHSPLGILNRRQENALSLQDA
jgi:hypothetical protein